MFAVVVEFEIVEGKMPNFLKAMHENATRSLADEAGCHRFDVCTDKAQPNTVFLYELYTDQDAFDTHTQQPHFAKVNAAVEGLVTAKTIQTYDTVFP